MTNSDSSYGVQVHNQLFLMFEFFLLRLTAERHARRRLEHAQRRAVLEAHQRVPKHDEHHDGGSVVQQGLALDQHRQSLRHACSCIA